MWMNFNIAGLALASLVAGQMASAGFSTAQAIQMAQNTAMPDRLPGRDVLVAGAGTVADGKSPATVMIDIGKEAIPARPKLELTLAPATIVPNEKYLIVVSIKPREGPPKRLGTTSFFPARAPRGEIPPKQRLSRVRFTREQSTVDGSLELFPAKGFH